MFKIPTVSLDAHPYLLSYGECNLKKECGIINASYSIKKFPSSSSLVSPFICTPCFIYNSTHGINSGLRSGDCSGQFC
jgi:hypothetical protein